MSDPATVNTIPIDDPDDPRLDDYRNIRDRDLRGPAGRPGRFMVESILPVEKMLRVPGLARSILITPNWLERLSPMISPDVTTYVTTFQIMRDIAGFTFHRGVLGVGNRPTAEDLTIDAAVPRRDGPLTVLLCEDINNIDNIGLLFRNAAAFAVDAVVLSPRCHDPLYRKCIRVSIGHVFNVPWTRTEDWHADLLRLKTEWGLTLIGAAVGPTARSVDEIPQPERVGIVIGQEYRGLSPATVDACDHLARIPMAAGIDSLNVSVAAAVCLHRFSRGERV